MIEPHPPGVRPKLADLPRTVDCMQTRDMPAVFLRFDSPRQQLALPYASLLKIEITTDQTWVDLSFATHQVTLRGKNLRRLYEAVSQAQAVQISVATENFAVDALLKVYTPFVSEIHVEPLALDERRRR